MDIVLHSRYKFIRKIGKGSYGEVWEGYDSINNITVAIKIENTTKNPNDLQLRHEYNVYSSIGAIEGFPTIYDFMVSGNNNFMIMQPVGHSLEQLYNICSKQFTLQTVLHIADQLIERLQQLHSHFYIHRDIKPDNFAIGLEKENRNKLYIIDFGLAQRFVDQNNRILPLRDKCQPTGNARYASLNNHLGCQQSRRDDLEGVAYMLIFFLTGSLPWINAGSASKDPIQRMKIVGQVKLMTSITTICQGTPPEFETFLRNVRRLKYEEEPHYDEYRRLFRDLYRKECIKSTSSLHASKSNFPNIIKNDNDLIINQINNNADESSRLLKDNISNNDHNNNDNDNSTIDNETRDENLNNKSPKPNRNEVSDLNLKLYLRNESNLLLDQANMKKGLSSRSGQFSIKNQYNVQSLPQLDDDDSQLYSNLKWDWDLIENYKPLITLEKVELSQLPLSKKSQSQKSKVNPSPPILQPRLKINPLMARKNTKFRSNYSKVPKRITQYD